MINLCKYWKFLLFCFVVAKGPSKQIWSCRDGHLRSSETFAFYLCSDTPSLAIKHHLSKQLKHTCICREGQTYLSWTALKTSNDRSPESHRLKSSKYFKKPIKGIYYMFVAQSVCSFARRHFAVHQFLQAPMVGGLIF